MDCSTIPLNLEPFEVSNKCEKRLWIGNLDHRVNEYQLLKLVRVHGTIEKLDMMYHRSGPKAGQSRGFAFITYKVKEDAVKAMNSLNGQLLGNKRIAVKYAKNMEDQDKQKPELLIPALAAGGSDNQGKLSKKMAIQCIEAKLRAMESVQPGDDFVVDRLPNNAPPIVAQYQTKLHQPQKTNTSFKRRHPYHRKR